MVVGNKSIAQGLDIDQAEWCNSPFHFQPVDYDFKLRIFECAGGPLTGQYVYLFSNSWRHIQGAGPALESGGKIEQKGGQHVTAKK